VGLDVVGLAYVVEDIDWGFLFKKLRNIFESD